MPRVLVIRALANSTKALSAYAIHERISKDGGRIDVVSVYRILATLEEVGLVLHVGVVDGYVANHQNPRYPKQSAIFVSDVTQEIQVLQVPQAAWDAILRQAELQGIHPSSLRIELTGSAREEEVSKPAGYSLVELIGRGWKPPLIDPETISADLPWSDAVANPEPYLRWLSREVWGSEAAAETFLRKPHSLLDHQPPIEALMSTSGARKVEDLLLKIEFGLPA